MHILRKILIVFHMLFLLTACSGSDALVSRMILVREVDAENQPMEEAGAASEFRRGDPVYLAILFTEAYEGLEVKVTWRQGQNILETGTFQTPRTAERLDPLWLSAELQTMDDWATGNYSCDVSIPDQGTQTLDFVLK